MNDLMFISAQPIGFDYKKPSNKTSSSQSRMKYGNAMPPKPSQYLIGRNNLIKRTNS